MINTTMEKEAELEEHTGGTVNVYCWQFKQYIGRPGCFEIKTESHEMRTGFD